MNTTFPVTTKSLSVNAGPEKTSTQIIVSNYSNVLFIICTQTGNIGSLTTSDTLNQSKMVLGDRMDVIPLIYANELVI